MIAVWFTAADFAMAELPGIPTTKRGVLDLAERAMWRHPEHEGRRWRARQASGGGYEYHIAVLPEQARVALVLQLTRRGATPEQHAGLSQWFAGLSDKKKATAMRRAEALRKIDLLTWAGMLAERAYAEVAQQCETSVTTLYRWRQATYGLDQAEWPAALAPQHSGRSDRAEMPEEAWEALKADYLRLEKPAFTDCHRRLIAMAKERGWVLPSRNTLRRRLDALPSQVVMLMRNGEEAVRRMYPAQERLRSHFHALEAVNADGHLWDVFVRWPDGSVARPMMCAFQDLYSGLLVSWRVDRTANAELTRLAFGDMVEHFAIPSLCYFDNGRDFTSKLLTGGTPNRYRFKVREEEPLGILPHLGVEVKFTNPYSGQSKPIERAFRDFAGGLAKHPRFAGAYCGNTPMTKPENYGSAAVPLDVFLEVVAEGIAEHNARIGRETRVCGGKLSFAQAFAASWQTAPIRKATSEQRRLWLLAAELIRVDRRDGSISIMGNRFWNEALLPYRGKQVTVRFDPAALQEPLHVYRTDGGYLTAAPCVLAAGFNDTAAAAEHGRKRKAFERATRDLAKATVSMPIKQLADMLAKAPEPAPLPENTVIRPLVVVGNTAMAPRADEDPDDMDWLEQANAARRAGRRFQVVGEDASGGDD